MNRVLLVTERRSSFLCRSVDYCLSRLNYRSDTFQLICVTLLLASGIALTSTQVSAQIPSRTPPAALDTYANEDSISDGGPKIITDGLGTWIAVWSTWYGNEFVSKGDILLSRSVDHGATWSIPIALNNTDTYNFSPQLTTDGQSTWVAAWGSYDSLSESIGYDTDILFSRSIDGGITWTAPVPLNTNAASDSYRDRNHQITTSGLGTWIAVWDSPENLGETIGLDKDILFSRSTDDGDTWTAPMPLNTNADTDSRGDIYPQLITDNQGMWVAVWSSDTNIDGIIGTNYDILTSRSIDDGITWSAPVPLNTNAEMDLASDYHPRITTDGLGMWIAAWESRVNYELGGSGYIDSDILVSRSDDGITWTAPIPLNTNAVTGSGFDRIGQLSTDGLGTWVAVWSSADDLSATIGTDADILVSHSTDDGATWSAPVPLNTNAGTDSGFDYSPSLTSDGLGNWISVWTSNDSLNESIGTDFDILFSIWTDTDRDGISDSDETDLYGTDPLNPDTDNDKTPDGEELDIRSDLLEFEIWVDFGYNGSETGAHSKPFNTLPEALNVVPAGKTIRIDDNFTVTSSTFAGSINQSVTLRAHGAKIKIGATTP